MNKNILTNRFVRCPSLWRLFANRSAGHLHPLQRQSYFPLSWPRPLGQWAVVRLLEGVSDSIVQGATLPTPLNWEIRYSKRVSLSVPKSKDTPQQGRFFYDAQ